MAPAPNIKSPLLMKQLTNVFVLALMAQLAAGCKSAPAAEQKAEEPAVQVQTAAVTAKKTPQRLRLTGSLRGAKETELAANVAGRVLKTTVERGQRVEKGALLAQIDVMSAQLALAEAKVAVETQKTQLDINKTDCERYEKLHKSGAVTDLEYDQVTAKCRTAPLGVEAAQARERMAAKNVGDGMIRSPFAGTITERFIEQGEYVQSSTSVVTLAQVDELKLVFSVPEKNYPDVKEGALVELQVAAYPDQIFTGKVAHISGAVRDTRDVVVEAIVDNKAGKLLPGMFADVDLLIGETDLPAVPKSATFEENGKLNVFVVNNGMLEQRVIFPARAEGDEIPVKKGLALGEQVVATYDTKLQNGQKVK